MKRPTVTALHCWSYRWSVRLRYGRQPTLLISVPAPQNDNGSNSSERYWAMRAYHDEAAHRMWCAR